MPSFDLIATCAFGLEAVVVRELKGLGYEAKPLQTGRVLFQGDAAAICRTNLWLRCADRVLIRLGVFPATDFGQLFDQTNALPWHEWITADGAFPVTGRSIKSQLSSVPACQKIVKKAVVEKLREAHATTELVEMGPRYKVDVSLLKDEATLTLDTTGASLHKRGYRKLTGEAQLKETLAAAMVLLSFWKPERPMIDPFCGTGTIPIEAALIGRNLAPGRNREFDSLAWPAIDAETWQDARQEADKAALPALPQRIIGTDINPEPLSLARYHAQQAGVEEDIHFGQRDFADLTSKRQYGCVITNPPYGQRLGDHAEVEDLYRSMPEVLRRLKTWSHYILTAYPDFEKLLGQKADRRRKLYNARIECTYYQFHGPNPSKHTRRAGSKETTEGEKASGDFYNEALSEAPVAAFGGLSAKAHEQAELFRTRLKKRAHHLRRWPTRRGITCYRLYDRDIPEIPLMVDRYEDHLHLAEYDRPHDRTPAEHADWLDLMVRAAGEILDVPRKNIFLKHRARQRGDSQYQRQGESGHQLDVQEAGLRFRVNLSDYLDTGLFLDHRITRSMVRDAADGKRCLNLFAYTGSFSVYAAAGGAKSTTTVDLSANYLEWACENMRLNGFDGPQHELVRSDAMQFLEGLGSGPQFDLAVVDPPTFSNSKRTDEDWDVQHEHVALLTRLRSLMAPEGVIYFSTNSRRFKLWEEQLSGLAIREISRQTVPEDFRNKRIHRCWRMVCTEG